MRTRLAQEMFDFDAVPRELKRAFAVSGGTKTEVAREAGVSRSQLDAYLAGDRQPSLPVLNRILRAMNHEVTLHARPVDRSLETIANRMARQNGGDAEMIEAQYVATLLARA